MSVPFLTVSATKEGAMASNFTELFVHLVWSTRDRQPLIQLRFERRLFAEIVRKCSEFGCTVVAIGGVENHVHLLISTGVS
jgi:REP element-mobilizing transposase RayT